MSSISWLVSSLILIGIVTLATHTKGMKENILKFKLPTWVFGKAFQMSCFVAMLVKKKHAFS
jgi:hypothetical protein